MLPLLLNINTKSLICLFFTKFYFLGSTYAPLTNSPLTNALVSAQSSINQGNTASLQTNTGTNGQQFVSYNGETYILQPSPNGTQLVATLNNTPGSTQQRSMSPSNGGNLLHSMEKFASSASDLSSANPETNSATQVCKSFFRKT